MILCHQLQIFDIKLYSYRVMLTKENTRGCKDVYGSLKYFYGINA